MDFLIINHYTNTVLRKIIYSSGQFTRQLRSVAAYILRVRKTGCNTLTTTGFQVTLNKKFNIKVRHPTQLSPIQINRRKQELYSKSTQVQLCIPSDTLLFSKVAYHRILYKFKGIDSFVHNPSFQKDIYFNDHFRRAVYHADIQNADLDFLAKLCSQYRKELDKKARVISLQPILPEKITQIDPNYSKVEKHNVSDRVSTLGDNVTRRETIIEPVKDGEKVRKKDAVSKKSSPNQTALTQSLVDEINKYPRVSDIQPPYPKSFTLSEDWEYQNLGKHDYQEIEEQKYQDKIEIANKCANFFALCFGIILGIIIYYYWLDAKHNGARGIVN